MSAFGSFPGRVLSVHRGLAAIELSSPNSKTLSAEQMITIGRRVNFLDSHKIADVQKLNDEN